MSRADVVRRFYAAVTARDLTAALDTLDPQLQFEPVLGILYREHVYRGHDGITSWYAELVEQWDSFDAIVEDAFDVDGGVTVFLHLAAQRGDERLDAEIAVECAFAGDRILRITGRDAWEVAEELGVPPPPGARR